MNFTIRQGLNIPVAGAPRQIIENGSEVSSVALSGRDFHGVRPEILVQLGERVGIGQPLFRARNRPEIRFTAPASGVVAEIKYSHHRSLESIVIGCEDVPAFSLDINEDVRAVLLRSGLWTAFKTRPFGHIPDPDAQAEAILVTAIDTNPLAADPAVILHTAQESFSRGLDVLAELNQTSVLVCQAAGPALIEKQNEHIRCEMFNGKHPAGLAGTHLDRIGLSGKSVWQIGYQDVLSIGHLFLTGQLSTERIVSLAGPMVRNPRLLRTQRGASLDDLLESELSEGALRVISGSVLSGRTSAYLGHYDTQVSVVPAPTRKRRIPLFARFSESPVPILPSEAFERALPQNILPIPLMRALSVGDWDAAVKLGCLDLLEEDVALLSYLCSSGNDYSALLRRALEDFAEGI
jgi:Na+-transporting NADH:ubiquinone oxidoreductase subunit A